MPVVVVDSKELYQRVGNVLGLARYEPESLIESIENLCFEYGLEYDGQDGDYVNPLDPTSIGLRLEIPANRYDLLCLEGISDALVRFKSTSSIPQPIKYTHTTLTPRETLIVKNSVTNIRPFCVGAIFRNCSFTARSLQAFMELQDKLHQNLGRRRTLVSCGTHDLDTVTGPFIYQALPKHNGFKFIPLNKTEVMDAAQMFDAVRDTYLKPYLPIIEHFDHTPVVQDSQGHVMSVPPITNSEHSKMQVSTKNVLVEITATDFYKAACYLDVITAFLAEYSSSPYSVEPMLIKYENEHPGVPKTFYNPTLGDSSKEMLKEIITPSLKTRKFTVSCDYVSALSGAKKVTADDIAKHLSRMGLSVVDKLEDGKKIVVECPITRRDILHACDIVEDFAIAYGFNNIEHNVHPSVGFQAIQNLSERVRRDIANCGWRECLTFGLVSIKDAYEDIRRDYPKDNITGTDFWFRRKMIPATVSDPKTKEFECARPTLIPGLLKTIASNQAAELPIRLFEIGEVLYLSAQGSKNGVSETGVCQRRHVAAIIADHGRSALEDIHGLLDSIFKTLRLKPTYATSTFSRPHHHQYQLVELSDETVFLDGRAIGIEILNNNDTSINKDLVNNGNQEKNLIGIMGVVHPLVLEKFNVPFPCSLFEFTLDPFLDWLDPTELITI